MKDVSTIIQRGDRVGIVGPNGAGKSTLVKILLGQLQPDAGKITFGSKLEVAYSDQLRDQLDPQKNLIDNVCGGQDFIEINGKRRHAISYLGDFLFSPERVRTPVKALSGGEQNRAILAKLFSKPANLLVLDEPTNDLDIETLELLEEILLTFDGTVLLVSHDRDFMDNVVTSLLVLEGDGVVSEHAGGYSDWEARGGGTTASRGQTGSRSKERTARGHCRNNRHRAKAQAVLQAAARVGQPARHHRKTGTAPTGIGRHHFPTRFLPGGSRQGRAGAGRTEERAGRHGTDFRALGRARGRRRVTSTMRAGLDDPRQFLLALFQTAVAAADPHRVLPPCLPRDTDRRAIVIGAGKAAAAMASALEKNWAGALSGLVVTPYGHGEPCQHIEVVEASHPIPDAQGEQAATRILELVSDLSDEDLVICLLSGGGSALLSLPAPGITLADKQDINRQLLHCGAAIADINCVRKHLSGIKGGRLARACYPAQLITFAISDVPGDDPAVIASGPTVADSHPLRRGAGDIATL